MDSYSSGFGFEVCGFGFGFGFEMSGFAHHWPQLLTSLINVKERDAKTRSTAPTVLCSQHPQGVGRAKPKQIYVESPVNLTKMQLDIEESTPASYMTYRFHSRIGLGNCHHAITC